MFAKTQFISNEIVNLFLSQRYGLIKGGLISESFLLQISKKRCQIAKEIVLRGVIWHLFLEILAKVINSLRLSHTPHS